MKKWRVRKLYRYILFSSFIIFANEDVYANRLFSTKTLWIPFNTSRFHSYPAKSRQQVGFYFPGNASLLQMDYTIRAKKNILFSFGVGYPFINIAIEKMIFTIKGKNISLRFLGGFNDSATESLHTLEQWEYFLKNPFIGQIALFYDLKKSEKNGHSLDLTYTTYSGIVSNEVLPGTFPGSKLISIGYSGFTTLNDHWDLNYSTGFSHIRILVNAEGDFTNSYNTYAKPFHYKTKIRWNAGFGFTFHF
ncbi:MAG: hypothetical protein H6696_15960 [Deferribacteres bacterium]|nr:hypothetical protein [Deferribacteres bacterium]